MRSRIQHNGFLVRRRTGMVRLFQVVLGMNGLLWASGFAFSPLISSAHCASGYLKPAVNARTLKKAEGYFDDGVELYERQKYRAAMRKFMAAERICPELFLAGYHVGLAHRKMGSEDAAITQLEKLNIRFPENIIAHNDLGVVFASRNNEESDKRAIREFEIAVRNGEDLLQGKEKEIAQVRVDLAMAYANLGALRMKKAKLLDAEKSFRKAVEHYPRAFFGPFGLGNVYFAMRKFGEAKKAYRKAQQIEPNNVSVHIALAKCYLFAPDRNPRFALAELKKVTGDHPPAEVFDLLGDTHALLGNTEEAAVNYVLYLSLPQRRPQTLYKIGVLYYNSGDRKKAKKYLEEFVSEAPDAEQGPLSTAYKLLGDMAREEEDYERAVAHYLKGDRLRGSYFSCHYGLADSYFHLEQYEKAKEYLFLVLNGLPKNGSVEQNELREKASALLNKIPSPQ